MKIIAVIPARYAATRFPAKLMQDLAGKPVIVRTYEATVNTGLFDEVFVATDSELIMDTIRGAGGKAIMSTREHESGSDRIAEAVVEMDVDIVVNVQGDEPFTERESLARVIDVFKEDPDAVIDLASIMTRITNKEEIENPNTVKVIVDQQDFAMYFSRSPIPHNRSDEEVPVFKHKGIYAFRKRALKDFTTLPIGPLEAAEKVEALRFLEHGKKIKMVESQVTGIEIDTPEDLERAKAAWT